jgi:hypothetical protein
VLLPLIVNQQNHSQWPKVVSDDVLKHVLSLKNQVFVISGQVKGKTLLPLSVNAENELRLETEDAYVLNSAIRLQIKYFSNITAKKLQCSPISRREYLTNI